MSLQKLYADLNRQFFRGKLPRYRATFSKEVIGPFQGICLDKRRLIRLRRGLPPQEIRQVLLHEMCHIRTRGHGRRWQEKMLRLAAQGEAWAKEEVDQYREAIDRYRRGDTLYTEVRDQLDAIAHALSPRPPFPSLTRTLATHHGYRSREFLKRIPWLKAAWKKACREADREAMLQKKAGLS